MALPLITPQMLREWNACYTDRRILSLFDGREALTPLEILALKIPSADRIWVMLRPEVLPVAELIELGLCFAERVLPYWRETYPQDERVEHLLACARAAHRGEVSVAKLSAALASAKTAMSRPHPTHHADVYKHLAAYTAAAAACAACFDHLLAAEARQCLPASDLDNEVKRCAAGVRIAASEACCAAANWCGESPGSANAMRAEAREQLRLVRAVLVRLATPAG